MVAWRDSGKKQIRRFVFDDQNLLVDFQYTGRNYIFFCNFKVSINTYALLVLEI